MAEAPVTLSYEPPVIVRQSWDNLMYTYIGGDILVVLLSPSEEWGCTVIKSDLPEYTTGDYLQLDEVEASHKVEFCNYAGSVTIGHDTINDVTAKQVPKLKDVQELVKKSKEKV